MSKRYRDIQLIWKTLHSHIAFGNEKKRTPQGGLFQKISFEKLHSPYFLGGIKRARGGHRCNYFNCCLPFSQQLLEICGT